MIIAGLAMLVVGLAAVAMVVIADRRSAERSDEESDERSDEEWETADMAESAPGGAGHGCHLPRLAPARC